MKKFASIGLVGLVALGVFSLATANADAATYKLEFIERDGGDDFEGTLTFTNVNPRVNVPSNCKGTLSVDGKTYHLNGTHWWPQSGSLPQSSRFYSVTLADPSGKVYLSLLLSFNKVTSSGNHRWGIAGQALMPEEGESNKRRQEWHVIGERVR